MPTPTMPARKDPLYLALIVLGFFAATAPTLTWMEFSSGSENLVVATALELRRPNDLPGSRQATWLIPTLAGEARVKKPPLVSWISAALIDPATVRAADGVDPEAREAALRSLAWQFRWPALLAACLTLVATYEVGRLVGGTRLAVLAALVHGSCYLFVRFGRGPTTDVHLALWVGVANAFLAHALLAGRRWTGAVGAGLAIGLAFLAKGPVALVQTVVPAVAFVAWRRWDRGDAGRAATDRLAPLGADRPQTPEIATGAADMGVGAHATRGRPWLGPALLGTVLFLAVAAPWFIYVAMEFDTAGLWFREVFRHNATDLPPDRVTQYLVFLPMMFPWLIFVIGGLMAGLGTMKRGAEAPTDEARRDGLVLAALWMLVPVLLMTLIRDRKERYLLPMVMPAAVLAGAALADWLARRGEDRKLAAAGVATHWGILAVVALGLPVVGMTTRLGIEAADGGPWFPLPMALAALGAAAATLLAGIVAARRRPAALVAATLALMLLVQSLFARGYAISRNGQSEMRPLAEAIRSTHRDALVYSYRPGREAPEDLLIYLGRTVRPAADPAKVPERTRPRVLLVHQRKDAPLPEAVAGATPFTTLTVKNSTWRAYFVPAGSDAPPGQR